jgi:hypothetical protein
LRRWRSGRQAFGRRHAGLADVDSVTGADRKGEAAPYGGRAPVPQTKETANAALERPIAI